MAEQVKQALREKDSAEAGLKTTERQAKDLRKKLHYCEINLATEKQMVKDLRNEFHKAREAAQLLKEQLRPKSRLRMPWGYRRLRADSQRSSLL